MAECQATTKNGRTCGAYAMAGERFCFMHSPAREAERRAARRLGGHRRGAHAGDAAALPVKTSTVGDVLALLDYTRDELLSLDNGIQRGRALIALAGEYIHALDVSEIETRLTALEAQSVSKK